MSTITKNIETTTKQPTTKVKDKFWGQPHHDKETFSDNEFERDFVGVYMNEPFLGYISLGISKFATIQCDTAFVGVNQETIELRMGYNPYFFRSLSSVERRGVITHELYHVVLQHLLERNIVDPEYSRVFNIATDLAINSILGKERLPELALVPGVRPTTGDPELCDFIENTSPMMSTEWYFEAIKRLIEKKNNGSGDGSGNLGTLDDHSSWEDIPKDVLDQIRDKVQGMIRESANKANSENSWGTVPQEIRDEILRRLVDQVDWRSILRMFFGTARSMQRISTIKKVSRKLPGILPGVKRGTMAKFAFFIDQSGSMLNEDVGLCFAEVEAASREAQIDVFNFDTEVDERSHRIWKRGHLFPWTRTRCGGTDFCSVARFVNRQENRGKWSGVCILTDGYAPTMGHIVSAKVLWVITPTGTDEAIRPNDLIVKLRHDEKARVKQG